MAQSSTEAEYRALAHTTFEFLWLESLLLELHISYFSPALLCHNIFAIMFSHNPILHARKKHIKLNIHFIRERVVANKLQIQHVPDRA